MRGGEELDDLDALERRFLAALSTPPRYRWLYKGRWRYALPLPLHTRIRLRLTSLRDSLAIWMCDRGHPSTAEAVWRLTGAWRKR